jgi:transposase InsO family protein
MNKPGCACVRAVQYPPSRCTVILFHGVGVKMASFSGLKPPTELKLTGNLSENWRRFKQQFEIYLAASGIKDDADSQKVNLFLHVIGPEALEVYNIFTWENGDDATNLTKVKKQFGDYCNPVKNITFERHVFNRRIQQTSESIDAFVTDLKVKASSCEFGTLEKSLIKDRIVCGVVSDSVRERMLREKDLTLEKAVQICRAAELSTTQVTALRVDQTSEVHALRWQQDGNRGKKEHVTKAKPSDKLYGASGKTTTSTTTNDRQQSLCRQCGYGSHPEGVRCPARGQNCRKCGGINHFAAMCRAKRSSGKKRVDAVKADDTDSDDEFYIGTVEADEQNQIQSKPSNWNVTVCVEGKQVTLKIDSGAQINTLPLSVYQKVTKQPLQSTKTRLVGYFGQARRPCGKATLAVEYKGRYIPVEFQIIDQEVKPVLGLQTSLQMNLIQRIYTLNTAEEDPIQVLSEYPELFEGLGRIRDVEYNIEIDTTVKPVVHAPRKVPIALKTKVKEELDRMVKQGVIVPVETPTDWVSSMVVVQKPGGKIRICIDPRDLNKAIKREHYPMKTVEEVAAELSSAKVFSVLDAGQAYYQIKVSDASSDLLTFNSPYGRYKFLRMPFGIKSAPEVWQRTASQIFDGLEGAAVIMDDVLVWGKDMQEHNERLRATLQRASDAKLTLNKTKCKVGVPEVLYMGHVLTENGMRVSEDRIKAIVDMEPPTTVTELQRFLGMINYVGKFIPNLAARTKPLRELLEKKVAWNWQHEHQKCMDDLKQVLVEAPVLGYYDLKEPVTVSVDASSFGLGGCLLQNGRPVAYASRSLNSAERNYAQIEKEMLAITWGCTKFHDYIYGRSDVVVHTDHKPLECLYNKPLHSAPPRIQRMMLKLQKYDFKVRYVPGKEQYISDTLSRATGQEQPESEGDEFEVFTVSSLPISDEQLNKFHRETELDSTLQMLKKYVATGWPESKDDIVQEARPYWSFREELSISDGLLLKSERLVVPSSLRSEMLARLHGGHLGIEKCQRRARDTLYWPGMNGQVSDIVSNCAICLEGRCAQAKEPMLGHEQPERPWQKLATDLFVLDGKNYVLLSDYYSKFVEYAVLSETTSTAVILFLKEKFACHGIPEMVVSDNGPQYASAEFKAFAKQYNFSHVTSSPGYPQSNGFAERSVQTLKHVLTKAAKAGEDPYLAVLEWRNTPIDGLGSPTQVLMSRRTRTLIPTPKLLKPCPIVEQLSDRLRENQAKQKYYYDAHVKPLLPLTQGDTVRMHTKLGWKPAVVTCKANEPRSYWVKCNGRCYRRNRRDLLATTEPPPVPLTLPVDTTTEPQTPVTSPSVPEMHTAHPEDVSVASEPPMAQIGSPQRSRVSGRVINVPARYRE